jgi:hypothetical protein
MKLPIFYDWNATWEYMFPSKDIDSTFRGLHSHCKSITVGNIDNSMHIALVWHIFTPIRNRSRIKHSVTLSQLKSLGYFIPPILTIY